MLKFFGGSSPWLKIARKDYFLLFFENLASMHHLGHGANKQYGSEFWFDFQIEALSRRHILARYANF